MKKTLFLLALLALPVCLAVAGSLLAPEKVSHEELVFLADRIASSEGSIGVFFKPDLESPLRQMKSGAIPEEDESYLELAINQNVTMLYTQRTIKGNFDSLIFVKLPAPSITEGEELTFYGFPGVTWLLTLDNELVEKDGKTEAQGWVKKLKAGYSQFKFLTPTTAYDFASPMKGNYSLQWNPEHPQPPSVWQVETEFADDVAVLNDAWQKAAPDGRKAAVEGAAARLKTDNGKQLAEVLAKKAK